MAAAAGCGGVPFMAPMSEQWSMPMTRPPATCNAQIPKIIRLYVPNNMVGAIIGAKVREKYLLLTIALRG